MTKIQFETVTGEVLEYEDIEEIPCRHKNIEYSRIESIEHLSIWICSKCGKRFNQSQLEDEVTK